MRWLTVICAVLGLWSVTLTTFAAEVHVAVAANFLGPVKAIKKVFEETTEYKVKLSVGSTGKLYAQITHGAPFEVFLAADKKRPKLLIEKDKLAVADSLFTYAQGRLALWSIQPDVVDVKGQVLKARQFSHIAIANPKTAPYGAASIQVMERFHPIEAYQGKIITGTSVSQIFQYIATGNADLGFIALSQLRSKGAAKGGSYWAIETELHDPIEQGAVLLKAGANNPAADAFLTVLKSEPVLKMIEEFGYGVPD